MCSKGSSSNICWNIGHLQGLKPFWWKSLFGEVIFEHVQNGSPKSCGSKKWVQKCRDQKFITIIFYWLKVLYLMIKKNFWFTVQIWPKWDVEISYKGNFGPHPGGGYGGRGVISFYEGAKGRYWSQISHRKLKISISHGVVIWAEEADPMLSQKYWFQDLRF